MGKQESVKLGGQGGSNVITMQGDPLVPRDNGVLLRVSCNELELNRVAKSTSVRQDEKSFLMCMEARVLTHSPDSTWPALPVLSSAAASSADSTLPGRFLL